MQHELIPRLSVGMAYYRRNYYNFWREDNILQSDSDYIPFSFTGPADSRFGQHPGAPQTLFNISPTAFGQSDCVLSNVDNVRLYNGLEWTAQGRFGRGGFFGGSFNYEKTQESTCNVENRNSTDLVRRSPLVRGTQFRLHACSPSPRSISSAAYSCRAIQGRTSQPTTPRRWRTSLLRPASFMEGARRLPTICFRRIPTSYRTRRSWISRFMKRFTMGDYANHSASRHLQRPQREHDDLDQQYVRNVTHVLRGRLAADHGDHASPPAPVRPRGRLVELQQRT